MYAVEPLANVTYLGPRFANAPLGIRLRDRSVRFGLVPELRCAPLGLVTKLPTQVENATLKLHSARRLTLKGKFVLVILHTF